MNLFLARLPFLAETALLCGIAVIAALILHWLAFAVLRRLTRRTEISGDNILLAYVGQPLRFIFILIALSAALGAQPLAEKWQEGWSVFTGIATPALLAWLAISILRAAYKIVEARSDISVEDNLAARRRRTRMSIFVRIGIFAILFVTVALMLLNIPGVRSIGLSLLASAGIAGLAIGAAAQPALKNLIAGVQLAFTEPIRIDDAVFIENEWGWIEEIRLTYVVIKLWDERRLIVPVSRILEAPFQNWTYRTANLLGSIFLYLDPRADIDRLRAKFEEIVKAEPLWNGQAQVLQVTETSADAIEVRMLATANNSPKTFDLRCEIREKMLAFIRDEMPEALPRTRVRMDDRNLEAQSASTVSR